MDTATNVNDKKNGSDSVLPRHNQPSPLFGLDIGGTLAKLVYFEPNKSGVGTKEDESTSVKSFAKQLTSAAANGGFGFEDEQLTIDNVALHGNVGTLHFLQFPTDQIEKFVKLLKNSSVSSFIRTLHVAGGGAFKFDEIFRSEANITLSKHHEIECLVKGINIINRICNANKKSMCFSIKDEQSGDLLAKEKYNFNDPFPYLATNIGSGVTMTLVKSEDELLTKYGSPFGGSSFLGLCSLLTGCNSFQEAIELASRGDSTKVDKSLADIYGEEGCKKMGVRGAFVGSNFGKMIDSASRKEAKKEDIAKALLMTVSDNIAHIAVDTAIKLGGKRIVFSGNFLRANPIAMQILAGSTKFWSRGEIEPLFFEHLGYHGAIGALFQN